MRRWIRPPQVIVFAYAVSVVLGTGALMLPAAHPGPGRATFVEALFTAVSAVCITGLVVVDTPTYWTPLGHVVILVLIQIGGIGVMTFASLLGLSVMRRIGLRSRLSMAQEVKTVDIGSVGALVTGIVKTTLAIEAVVALVVFVRLLAGYESAPGRAAWLAVFHTVSAFNNGGFALHSDSLVRYVADPWVCLPLCAAVILGGMGYPVLLQLRREWGSPLHWTMNTRIVLLMSGTLLLLGSIFVTVSEWSNRGTFGPLGVPAKLLAGFTHSTMARSAGFNSVDTSAMEPVTWLGTSVLMFIGGGPAGTAGGIKVTTFAVLLFVIITEIRGERAVNILGKRLPRSTHRQAISIALLAVAVVVSSTIALMAATDFGLDRTLFEVVSAFATVGLSTGITADLPAAAQVLLVVLMFVGRLGPITLATALVFRHRTRLYELPKERPIIG
ncbi:MULTISPECIES: TrkH family potassium uptake protein [unclassified Micromonospora]|uniref:TrkH family potassium uptake protein n=1 Tax=unclassified Micromonospora TaxID=2617518 RepID=UPI00158FBE77|nr:potassium transporter TrkG [Verrucosispora sp. NA02020]QKW13368.1 TrkH family potassium uptake protein [Verrucosispora sp. NA02020]